MSSQRQVDRVARQCDNWFPQYVHEDNVELVLEVIISSKGLDSFTEGVQTGPPIC